MKKLYTVLLLALASALLPVRTEILATGDLRANLAPVRAAPGAPGRFARIAGALNAARETGSPVVVDAGNALRGGSQGLNTPALMAELFAAADYQALNLTPADFGNNPDEILALVRRHGLPAISANLVAADGEDLLLPPAIRVPRADGDLLIIGLTAEMPASALQILSPGIRTLPPADALRRALADAGDGDRVIVLFHGAPMAALQAVSPVRDRIHTVILNGDGRAPALAGVPLLFTGENGTRIGRIRLDGGGADTLTVTTDTPVHPGVRQTIDTRLQEDAAAAAARRAAQRPGPPRETPSAGEPVRLIARDAHQGLGLTVFGWRLEESLADQTPAPGHVFLVIDAAVENRIRPRLTQELDYPAAVQVATLENKLYLAWNGRRIIRHRAEHTGLPGHLPNRFRMTEPGSAAEGLFVFEIPATDTRALSLLLYHDEFPALSVPLLLEADPAEAAQPKVTAENEVLSLEVHSLRRDPLPEKGMVRFTVDLRGKSLMTRMADSAALDPAVSLDDNRKVPHAIPAEYDYFPEMFFLSVGESRTAALNPEFTELPAKPAFPPDRHLGGTVVFDVPEAYADHALSLRAWFPGMAIAGDRRAAPVVPQPLALPLQDGDHIPLPDPVAALPDGEMELRILEVEALDRFHGHPPPENRQWIRFLLQITNNGNTPGLMPMPGRFGLTHSGQRTGHDLTAAAAGPFGPGHRLYLHTGESRIFETVISSPADTRHLQFDYRGIAVNARAEIDLEAQSAVIDERQPDSEAPPVTGGLETVRTAETEVPESPVRAPAEGDTVATPPRLPPPEGPFTSLPRDPEAEPLTDAIPLNLSLQNERLNLSVSRAYLFNRVHGRPMEDGKTVLGLHLEVQRRDDTDAGRDQHFVLRNWDNHVRLVDAHGRLISPQNFRRDDSAISDSFRLQRTSQTEAGLLYFELSTASLGHIELLWLDAEFGHMRFSVLPAGGDAVPEAGPLFAAQNQIVSLQVHGSWTADTFRDVAPPDDHWKVFDLRARSLRPAFPHHLDADVLLPRDWRDRVHLLIDGQHLFTTHLRGTDLPDEWMLTPLRHTGGPVGFSLPEGVWAEAESAEILLSFGPHTPAAGGRLQVPDLIRIPVKGTPPPPYEPEQRLTMESDLDLEVVIAGINYPEELPGSRAGPVWVAADLVLTATRPEGLRLDPAHRFRLLSPSGNTYRLTQLHWGEKGMLPGRRAGERILPPGVPLPLRMIWRVPEDGQEHLYLLHAGTLNYSLHPAGTAGADEHPSRPPALVGRGLPLWDADRTPGGIESVGLTPEEVNGAIDRGRDFLWQQVQSNFVRRGQLSGRRYLIIALYALVNVDAHKEYPEFDALLREYLFRVNPNDHTVYENGLLAMILRAYGDPDLHGKLEQVSRWLVESQGEAGTWRYTADVPDHFFPSLALEEPEAAGGFRVEGGEPPRDDAPRDPDTAMHRTISFRRGADGDNSTTQFAVLGLWSIGRAGMDVDPDIWERTLMRAAVNQALQSGDDLGGFSYSGMARNTYGSMTAAGLSNLALAMRHLDAEADVQRHPRILNALAWLADPFSVTDHPRRNGYHYYYLYSLERVGQILGTEFIGEHEWYPLGARHLVDTQQGNGSWPGRSSENNVTLVTAYSLLFLVRATPAMDEEIVPEPEPEGPGTLATRFVQPPEAADLYIIFDASGSMRAEVEGVSKFDLARQALLDLMEEMPEDTHVALRAFGHRFHALHARADEDTELILPRGPLDREQFTQVMQRLRPRGKTPLALTLEEAARDLRGRRGGPPTQVIMFTDGAEDTREDPVAAARNFAENAGNIEFTMLGFNIQNPVWLRQLEEVASTAGGLYVNVRDPRDLLRELEEIIRPPAPAFTLHDAETGAEVLKGTFGDDPHPLEPGQYLLRSLMPGQTFETRFWIHPGRETRVHFDWQAAANP